MAEPVKPCAHGHPGRVRCIDCEIDWYTACLADALARVRSCTEKVVDLTKERSQHTQSGGGEKEAPDYDRYFAGADLPNPLPKGEP